MAKPQNQGYIYIQRRRAFHFLSCFLWKEAPAPASTTHTPRPSASPECPLSSGAVPEISCESVQTACACRPPPLQPVIQQSTKGTVSSFLENLYISETMSHDHRWRQEQVSIPGRWQHSCLWDVRVKDVLFGAATAVAGKSFNSPLLPACSPLPFTCKMRHYEQTNKSNMANLHILIIWHECIKMCPLEQLWK